MGKIIKAGRVVVVLSGRMAGKKAVVVNTWDSGSKERSFGHCLVAGVEKAPLKVHKKMSKKRVDKRCRVKPFIRYVNYNHIMPTRYHIPADFDPKALLSESQMSSAEDRQAARQNLRKVFKEKFLKPISDKTGKVSKDIVFLRKRLRF